MRVAIYARVSTTDQTSENQLEPLRTFVSHQGWTITAEYIDSESGTTSRRPELRQMFDAASRREFDLILFWSLDRFTREGATKALRYLEQLSTWGVKVRSYTEPHIDTTGPFGELLIAFVSTMARLEAERIRQRTIAGLARARKEGKQLGRPRRVVNAERAMELHQAGFTFQEIGRILGVSKATVCRRLKALADPDD